MTLIAILLILALVCSGGGLYMGGPVYGAGGFGVIIVLLIVLWLLGVV